MTAIDKATRYERSERSKKLFAVHGIASKYHEGQKRKYTGEPYITHPNAVAGMVAVNGGDERQIMAALLHDVIEDTTATVESLQADLFFLTPEERDDVISLVVELTDVYTKAAYPDLNRKRRKELECERLAGVSDRAKQIKLFDMQHNTNSISKHDPKFWAVAKEEIDAIMKVIKKQ